MCECPQAADQDDQFPIPTNLTKPHPVTASPYRYHVVLRPFGERWSVGSTALAGR
jgi:hypothetical protein